MSSNCLTGKTANDVGVCDRHHYQRVSWLAFRDAGAGIAGAMLGVSSEMYFYAVAEGEKLLRITIVQQHPTSANSSLSGLTWVLNKMALNEIKGRLALITGASGG